MDRLKAQLRQCLQERAFDALSALVVGHPAGVRKLYALLYDAEPLVRWRAVLGFGRVAERAPELVRRTVSRLAYALNDEAGVCAWSTAPAVAEIGHRHGDLTKEVVRIVVHYFEDAEACQSVNRNPVVLCSALWAVGRVGVRQPTLLEEVWPTLARYTGDALPEVRGHAYWAMGHSRLLARPAIRGHEVKADRRGVTDETPVSLFDPDTAEMPWRPVKTFAQQAFG